MGEAGYITYSTLNLTALTVWHHYKHSVHSKCTSKCVIERTNTKSIRSHLHEVVVDASQAVGSANILLPVPLIHQRAVVLRPQPPAEVVARREHGLTDLRKETTHLGSQTLLICRIGRN